jgi:predicted RecB family nuclease
MAAQLVEITGIGPAAASTLVSNGFKTVESIADTTTEKLSAVQGFSVIRAQKTIDAAKQLLASAVSGSAGTPSVKKPASKKAVKKSQAPKDKKSKDKKGKKTKKPKDKKKKDKGKKKKNKSKNKKK